MRPTTVAVVIDSPIIKSGVLALLAPVEGIEARDSDPRDVVIEGADVVIYDAVALVDGQTAELEQLAKECDCAVLVITRDLAPALTDVALAHGADGCVSLAAPVSELIDAVQAAAWGDLHGTGQTGSVDYTVNPVPAMNPREFGLTGREYDVLLRIVQGQSNQEIAEELYLSINSVKTYIRSTYRRIDVASRSQAVAWGYNHGLGDQPAVT
jgi:DNA-binding NarL/FixJ family response regulator